jgi:hypothetical protein
MKRGRKKPAAVKRLPPPRHTGKKTPHKRTEKKTPPKRTEKKPNGAKRPRVKSEAAKRQNLAHRKVLEYVARLGKRKAAARLQASVRDLNGWLAKKFPQNKLTAAIGLGKPGGAFTTVKGTDLGRWMKKVGRKTASTLTGVPAEELVAIARKLKSAGRRAGIRFERSKLADLIKKKGLTGVADLTGAEESSVSNARHVRSTQATKRLKKFVKEYGKEEAATYFGISPQTLKRWIEKNVPPSWEKEVNHATGTAPDRGASSDDIKGAPVRNYKKNLAKAWKTLSEWNKKVPRRFQVTKATAERWVRIGTFESNLSLAQKIYEETKKTIEGTIQPPPVDAPPPPTPSIIDEKDAKLPDLPKPPKPERGTKSISEIQATALADFKEARAEAFFKGEHDNFKPMNSWSRISQWSLINRYGVRVYVKVQQFVQLLNLTAVGNTIIDWARKIWKTIKGKGEYMTIRLTFSAQGQGNPFYAEAWVPDETKFSFFTRNTDQIVDIREIDYQVRALLKDVFEVSNDILLFFEHFEVIKSLPKEG